MEREMKVKGTIRKILIVLFILAIIGLDQLTKDIVRNSIEYGAHINVIKNFITLTKVENTGAFLSLGNSLSPALYKLIMIILPLVVIIYASWFVLKGRELTGPFTWGLCFIIGGGLGNIIDRILFGSVTDFLHFNFVIFQTGIVNVADMAVTAGFFILVFEMVINRRKLNLAKTRR